MEYKIQEYLEKNYKNIIIDVESPEIRIYQIIIILNGESKKIEITYNAHYTFETNMEILTDRIDKTIVKFYKKEGV